MLRLLDLFSGIGGFSYAAERLLGGFQTVGFVECDPYCQRVLNQHWPAVPIHPDVKTFTAPCGFCDVITAGFPCQDLSAAGKLAGLTGARSGLFYEVIRLARELRPRFIVLENVANLVSHANGATLQEVLYQLAKAGFDAEWAVIPASDVGACHRRARVWIVAHSNSTRPQGQRGECELGEGGCKVSPAWRSGDPMLSSEWGGYISQPVLRRGDDGLSNRVDRLRALGNSIVPQCAVIPLQRVLDLAEASQ